VTDISHKHCRLIQRADGYAYARSISKKENTTVSPSTLAVAAQPHAQDGVPTEI